MAKTNVDNVKRVNLILKPLTHKAKNILAKWGNEWKIWADYNSKILIVSMKDTSGPTPDSARWIELQNDPDFEVEKL